MRAYRLCALQNLRGGAGGHINFRATYWYKWGRPHLYQNAKQETFWARIEGRVMAMLEGEPNLTLELLNQATHAWIEREYHHAHHSEIGATPLKRYLAGPDVGRECPSSDALRAAFRIDVTRTQRRSDGTVSLDGTRFEIPSAYRHLQRVDVVEPIPDSTPGIAPLLRQLLAEHAATGLPPAWIPADWQEST